MESVLKVIAAPPHIVAAPLMTDGCGFTVIMVEAGTQPAPVEYVIVALPGDKLVTIPPLPTEATVVLPLLHIPPFAASDKVTDAPAHILQPCC